MVLRGISHLQTTCLGLRLVPGGHLSPAEAPARFRHPPPARTPRPWKPIHGSAAASRTVAAAVGCQVQALPARLDHGEHPEWKTAGARRGGGCGRAGQRRARSLLRRARGLTGSLRRVLASPRASPRRGTLGGQRSLPLRLPGSALLANPPSWLQTPPVRDSEPPQGRDTKKKCASILWKITDAFFFFKGLGGLRFFPPPCLCRYLSEDIFK